MPSFACGDWNREACEHPLVRYCMQIRRLVDPEVQWTSPDLPVVPGPPTSFPHPGGARHSDSDRRIDYFLCSARAMLHVHDAVTQDDGFAVHCQVQLTLGASSGPLLTRRLPQTIALALALAGLLTEKAYERTDWPLLQAPHDQ